MSVILRFVDGPEGDRLRLVSEEVVVGDIVEVQFELDSNPDKAHLYSSNVPLRASDKSLDVHYVGVVDTEATIN